MSIDVNKKVNKDVIEYLLERKLFGISGMTEDEVNFLKAVSNKTIKISFG